MVLDAGNVAKISGKLVSISKEFKFSSNRLHANGQKFVATILYELFCRLAALAKSTH